MSDNARRESLKTLFVRDWHRAIKTVPAIDSD